MVQTVWFRTDHQARRYGDAATCDIRGADLADIARFLLRAGRGRQSVPPPARRRCLAPAGARRHGNAGVRQALNPV
ncbi:hypothetical protein GCM10010246_52550 [Streptomyces cuspidosporus]|uniref:Uncharacterized protein n=1 Tax=Streptomyces cuspidosporus TaxID=66882 RepID=A0ABP5TP27_9ACTN